MDRREFLHTSVAAAAALPGNLYPRPAGAADTPGFASPAEAVKAPREKLEEIVERAKSRSVVYDIVANPVAVDVVAEVG